MTILQAPHNNKPLKIRYGDLFYERHPIKTKVIMPNDGLANIIFDELNSHTKDGDVILVAESALSADQDRAIPIEKIHPGWLANTLTKYMTKTDAGIGASDPLTMQVVIDEVGYLRVLLGAFIAGITKPFGIKGMFYRIAGEQARGVDGPADYVIPPYNKQVVRAPKNPGKWALDLQNRFKAKVKIMVMDANDLGINILEPTSNKDENLGKALAFDNPLGQSDESTPVLWCKRL